MSTKEETGVKDVEVNESETKERKCFIITPIGGSNDAIFRHINGVIQSVIRPVLKDYGFSDVRAAHEISDPGSINNQLVNRIIDDDLVIANLTGKNPNVMYELCLRHAAAKPVIHICEEGTNLPFDIKGERTIFYTNDMYGSEELKTELIKALDSINYDNEYKDNPIYSAIQIGNILKTGDNEKIDAISLILREIQRLSQEIASANKTDYNVRTSTSGNIFAKVDSQKKFIIKARNYIPDQLEFFIDDLFEMANSYGGATLDKDISSDVINLDFNLFVHRKQIIDNIIRLAASNNIELKAII